MVGLACGVSLSFITKADPLATTLLISTSLIGSIFPDIDNEKSHFGQLTKPISSFICAFGSKGYNHRGLFHSFLLYAFLGIIAYLYAPYLLGFFVGAISHLILDAFNPAGDPLFPFLSKPRLHLANIPSQSGLCTVISFVFFILILAFGIVCAHKGFVIKLEGTINDLQSIG